MGGRSITCCAVPGCLFNRICFGAFLRMSDIPTLIILAGGASSRMWPLREKSLLSFGAEPLLLSQLRTYESLGFSDVVIVGNPQNEADIRSLIDKLEDRIHVRFAVQPEAKGMGDAVLCAADVLP